MVDNEAPRWKYFDVVGRILNNEYQPKDVERLRANDTQLTTTAAPTQKHNLLNILPSQETSSSNDPFQKMLNSGNWGQFQCAILPEYNAEYNVSDIQWRY